MEINLKRFLSLALALLMVFGMFPTNFAYASEDDATFTVGNAMTTSASTLEEAIAAAEYFYEMVGNVGILGAPVIKLEKDYVLANPVVIESEYPIIIDLNGNELSYSSTVAGTAMLTNKGDLTLKNGTVAYTFEGPVDGSKAANTIRNDGTLAIEAKVTNTSKVNGQIGYAVDCYPGAALIIKDGGVVTASGSNYYDGVRLFCNSETEGTSVTVTGGEVSSIWMQNPSDGTGGDNTKDVMGSVTIIGGEVDALYLEPSTNFNGTVEGGTIGKIAYNETAEGRDLTGFVTGGTIGSVVDGMISDGYELDANGNVVEVPEVPTAPAWNGETIGNLDDLKAFAAAVNGGDTFEGKTVTLTADIDLGSEPWSPIGTGKGAYFSGTFDGGNFTIRNLVVNGDNNVGFFGYADGCSIKNLKIVNATVTGVDCVGAIAGQVYSTSTIDNCHVSGSIKIEGQTNVGGIVGKYYVKVSNSSVIGDGVESSYVKGTYKESDLEGDNVGGIMGHGGEDNNFVGNTVKDITVSGTRKVGGIVGTTDHSTDVTGAVVENVKIETTATVDYSASKASSMGLGGLIGHYYSGGSNGTVAESTVTGVTFVIPEGVTAEAGAIVGNDRANVGKEPAGITFEDNNVGTVTGTTNTYLQPAPAAAKIGDVEYATLKEAFEAVQDGETITLLSDQTIVGETYKVPTGVSVTLDMNGKKLTVTDNKAANVCYELFYLYSGNMTVTGNGTIELTSTSNDTDWAKSSSIFHNRGGVLTIENGTFTHLGGTAMAFVVDNSGNYSAEATTNISGGTLTSSYIAIRNRMDKAPTSFKVTLNVSGGTINGEKRAIWAQASSADVNNPATGEINISGGEIGLIDTARSAGATAMTTISGGTVAAFKGEVGELTVTGTAPAEITMMTAAGETVNAKPNADGVYVEFKAVAEVNGEQYATLAEAIAAAQTGETVTILAGEHSEGTIKLPAALKNVTIKGETGAVLKNMTISAADGNSYSYIGLTFDGITFDNSRILLTGWRNGEEIIEDLTVTNCTFKNLNDTTNSAPVHINKDASEAVKNFTFTGNTIDGATGGSKSGVYAQVTGKTTFTGNTINNVSFRPYVIQVTTDDGVADEFIVTGNTFSGSAAGRAQGLGSNAAGTDTVKLVVSDNIFKGITDAQQICYWNFNAETTTADLSKNYYDIDIAANPSKIYFNSAAADISDLIDMGIYPYYSNEAKTTLVAAPAIMVTYANGTVEYFDDMLKAVPYKTNYDKLQGATITLLADVMGKGIRFMETDMVLDLNGHTYTINNATGSSGSNTSGFQIREDAANVTIKNGIINVAAPEEMEENPYVVWMFNSYSANLVVEDVTIWCTNMAWSYGENCYVHVSRPGDNTVFTGSTNINGFDGNAGNAINVGGTMTVTDGVVLGGSVELDAGATLTAPAGLDVTAPEGYKVVYANGVYSAAKCVAKIGDTYYETFEAAAAQIATDGSDTTIKLLSNVELSKVVDLVYGTGKIILTADQPVTVKQVVLGSDLVLDDNKATNLVIGENVTLEIYDNNSGLYMYYGPCLTLNGTITGGQNWGVAYLFNGNHVVTETGKLSTGRVQIGYADVTVNGEVDTNYLLVENGTFTADGAAVDANVIYDNNNGALRWGASRFVIKNGSAVTTNKLTLSYADSVLTIDGTSTLTATTIVGAGKIVIDAAGLEAGASPIIGNASGFTGTLEVINSDLLPKIDENGNIVLVAPVAQVGDVKYGSVLEALKIAIANGASEVKLLADSREAMPTDVELLLNADLKIVSATGAPVAAKFYNNGSSYDFVINSATGFEGKTLTIGENVTFQLEDRVIWAGYYGNNVNVVVEGTLAGYQYWNGADTTVKSTGVLKATGEAMVLRRGADLTVEGGTVNANYFSILAGNIIAKDRATITCGAMWINNTGSYANEGNVNITIENSTLTCKPGNLTTASTHADGVKIDIINSTVEFLAQDHGDSNISAKAILNITNSDVTFRSLVNTGTVNITGSTVKLNKLDNDSLMFLNGTNTFRVEDASGSSYAVRANDGVVLNNSYMKGSNNETFRLLGSATFNGGFECAYLQGSSAGVGGTVTIEDGTTVKATYGVEFSKDYTLNGGTIELSGGNASGKLWGMVFQSGTYEINTDLIVTGNSGTYAPIHFTDATAVINSSITQTNSGGEPMYIGAGSTVTLGKDAVIDTLAVHGTGKLILDATGVTAGEYANVKCKASGFTGTIEVINNDLEAKIVGGKIVLAKKPVAKIGEVGYGSLTEALAAAQTGDEIVLLADATISQKITVDFDLTIDGNGKTLTYTGSDRAIDVPKTAVDADVTIKNLTLNFTGGYSQRGINYNTNGKLTLDNVTVNGTNVTYAVNMPSSSTNAEVEINNSKITGLIALNVWGANAKVVATNSHFTSVDKTDVENYAAVKLNSNGTDSAEGATITITGGSITALDENGNPSSAVTNATTTGVVDISDTTVVKGNIMEYAAVVLFEGATEFYGCFTLQDAIDKAANNPTATVKLLKDITISEKLVIEGNVTIDGNGKTLTYTGRDRAIDVPNTANGANVTIKNLTVDCTASYCQRGINYNDDGALTLDKVTVKGTNVTYALNLPGSSDNCEVTITDSSLTGNIALNIWGQNSTVTATNSVFTSVDNTTAEGYVAISLNNDGAGNAATGSVVTINGGKIIAKDENGDPSTAVRVETAATVNVSGETEVIGDTKYEYAIVTYEGSTDFYSFDNLQDAIDKAIESNGKVVLINNITVGEKLTVSDSVVIDGNGFTLTYTGSDRAIDIPANADKKVNVTIENLTVDCTGSYCQRGINYNDDGALTLNNVTVKGTNVTYALNLPGSSDNAVVTITDSNIAGNIALNVWGENATVNATNTTFTAVDNNAVEGYAAVKLNNDGTTSAEGAVINITGGKIDVTGSACTDTEAASNATATGKINISDSTGVNGEIKTMVAIISYGDTFYSFYNLADAFAKAQDGETVKLIADCELSEAITVTKKVTLDLNGKTIVGTDNNTSGNFYLFDNRSELTINDTVGGGKITLTANTDRDWNASSVVVANNPGGKLTVNGGTIEHLGGTDMAYGIDNLTNGKGTYAETVINGGTVKSTYRAVRQFLNGVEAENILTVNGGTIEGANKSIWMQDPSAKANSGTLTVGENAVLKGDVYLYVTPDSTEWPVTVSIASAALDGESTVLTGNVPYGYVVEESSDVWGVRTANYVAHNETTGIGYESLAEAIAAAQTGETVTLLADVTINELVKIEKAITLDLNGKKVTSTAQKAFEVYANATIQNGTIEAAQRCVDTRKAVELTLTDVTLIADQYTTYGNPQPLTIGGSENGTKVTMTNVNISAAAGYGIITFVKTELTATDSTISGYNALYVKPGSENSTFNFVNTDLSGSTVSNDVSGNSFSTIAVRADNITVNVDANSTVTATGNYCWAISLDSQFTGESGITGAKITVLGDITGQVLTSADVIKNTITVKAEYADELNAAGYAYIDNENGTVTATKAVAQIGNVNYATLQEAVNAVADGGTIELLADCSDEMVFVKKEITVKKNGFEADLYAGRTADKKPLMVTENDTAYVVMLAGALDANEGAALAYVDLNNNGQPDAGETMQTLQDALDAAAKTGTATDPEYVRMTADLTVGTIILPTNVVLDIDAWTLTADRMIGLDGSKLMANTMSNSTESGSGYLKIEKNNLLLDDGCELSSDNYGILPIWNEEAGHYEFAKLRVYDGNASHGLTVTDDTIEFRFKHQVGGYYKRFLLNDGGIDNGVKVTITLSWETDDGIAYQTFVYKDQNFANVNNASNRDYYFTLTNYGELGIDLSNVVTITAAVETDCGMTHNLVPIAVTRN